MLVSHTRGWGGGGGNRVIITCWHFSEGSKGLLPGSLLHAAVQGAEGQPLGCSKAWQQAGVEVDGCAREKVHNHFAVSVALQSAVHF